MRLHIWGVLLLASAGCKDNPVSRALGEAASAQAAAASAQGLASAVVAASETTITGTVRSQGGELGTWDLTLDSCKSGELNGFYGVDFFAAGSDDLRVRYVHDEAVGDVVKVMIPSKKDTALVFDRDAKCTALEGAVERTNVSTWTPKGKVRHVNGHVKFDCTHGGGKGHVTGEATFSHCH